MSSKLKIVLIHAQNHKGSTYHISRMLAEKISDSIVEFFLPRHFSDFCIGCTNCFMVGEEKCPHYEKLNPITEAMDQADLLIFDSPVYVFHATGSMKAFLDHYGYRWMVHRPEEKMFHKQAVCIATAAGAGMRSTIKDMADSMYFWGIAKIYRYGIAVRATSYEQLTQKTMTKIDRKTTILAKKIEKNSRNVRPGIRTKLFFHMMSLVQRKGFNEADRKYWAQKGWTKQERPWKSRQIG
ncbi:MAG: flavodoxin family protein [Lachnospiraceae bacterium]